MDIDGDGSFLMNCQELATAAIEKMDIKMFILNNQHLGMVVQWEDRFYKVCGPCYYLYAPCISRGVSATEVTELQTSVNFCQDA